MYYSNGNVNGEGEHKIFDHIRLWKQSPDFDPQETHCIYGNDSDLILLSLVSHLNNVVILREENDFSYGETINSGTARSKKEITFELVFISLL